MKRTNRLIWIALAVALLASTWAMADQHDRLGTPNLPHATQGHIYDRNNIVSHEHTVQLPVANDDGPDVVPVGRAAGPQASAVAQTMLLVSMSGSSLIPARGAAAMATPEQQAEREIHKLIRKLD